MSGKLYIIPTVLAEGTEEQVLSPAVRTTVGTLRHFLCENIRTARRFVGRLQVHASLETLQFELLDKDTEPGQLAGLMSPIKEGADMGVLSESGCPGIADPGAIAVEYAHEHGITVVPLVGPSSIILALMASGLNGQQFAFHGYLPIQSKSTESRIRTLERESRENNQTQIFIETPYRNNQLLKTLLAALQPDTRLCLAINLTAPSYQVICRSVGAWKTAEFHLEKVPVTYLFLAGPGTR